MKLNEKIHMKRYFLHIQYKGTNYHGWQVQPNAITVQEEVEGALSTIFQDKVDVMGAGRTDTGVHASCLIAHFDREESFSIKDVKFKLNNILSRSISIDSIREVQPEFHARFDATSRSYEYRIGFKKDPFLEETSFVVTKKLDVRKMNKAAQLLLGEKDFSCFSKSKTQTFTNNCNVVEAVWVETLYGVMFKIKANRFLRNMVRAIVGTLLEVGEGKRSVESMEALILSKNRSNAGFSVPARGLFLVDIEYPQEGFIE